MVDSIINTIVNSAKTGKIGDGKIFVSSLDEVVKLELKRGIWNSFLFWWL